LVGKKQATTVATNREKVAIFLMSPFLLQNDEAVGEMDKPHTIS
jgi:hypothetical protein